MTEEWTLVYKALYKNSKPKTTKSKKSKDEIKAVKKTRLSDNERKSIIGE